MSGEDRGSRTGEAGEFSWLALLDRAWAQRRPVMTWAVSAALAAAAVLLVVPETYRARATLLPPRNEEMPGLAAMLSTAGTPMLGFGSSNVSSEIFVEILRSRSMADAIVDSLGLIAEYGFSRLGSETARDAARRRLQSRSTFASSINGVVSIQVEHKTGLVPKFRPGERRRAARLAAAIANTFVHELDRVNVEKNTLGAHSARVYLETQLAQARDDQAHVARDLVAFQARHGAIALEEQTRLTLEAAGDLEGRIQEKRLELDLLRRTDSESSPRVRAIRAALEALERERDRLLGLDETAAALRSSTRPGAAGPASLRGGDEPAQAGMIPVRELPQLVLEYSGLVRDLKAKELLIEHLTQRYYEARLDESRLTPVVEVLDEAIPPVNKAAPKRSVLVLLAALLGGLAGLLRVLAVGQLWSRPWAARRG